MTAYVAPAARLFTEAHIPATAPGSPVQVTMCGRDMDPADVWMDVDLAPGERVCPGCLGVPEDEQGALL